jgi:glycerol uptake operon antiterminator
MTTSSRSHYQQHLIAAVRNDSDILRVLKSKIKVVFLLAGDLCSLEEQSRALRAANKQVFLHMDLVEGLKSDASGIRFVAQRFQLTGIISTKATCIKLAREAGLRAILRVFVLDSSALRSGLQHAQLCRPDSVEVLPGVSEKIIRLAAKQFKVPIIAGGLIEDNEDLQRAIDAGAGAVSTSNWRLWA